jgi:outer membrane protein assembly factor BamB
LPTRALLLGLVAVACGSRLAPPPILFPASEAWKASAESGLEGPLASDGRRLFLARRDGSVEALDRADGRSLWRREPGVGQVSAAEGIVLLRAEDGAVTRLNPENGRVVWRSETGVAGRAPALPDAELLLVYGAGLAAASAADGRLLWRAEDGADVSARPVSSGTRLFVGEEDGTLRCRDRASGATSWTLRTLSALRAPALLDRERVLLGTTDGRFLSLTAEEGRIRWRWRLGADVVGGAVLFGRDSVLFATYENVLYALDRDNGHLKWRAPLPSRPIDGPRLSGSAALVACQENEVLAFDARSGRRLASLAAPAEIRTPPVLLGDRLYLGLRDRSVVAFGLDLRPTKEVKLPRGPRPTPPPEAPARGRERSRDPLVQP